ncbi:MAG: hypothetical protein KBS64_08265 [Treponema sp.]|nr:hypothetical protein [Candidatus Treponema equi]
MAEDFTPPVIEEKIGILSTSKAGWTTELNLVSWGGRPAKYDIRSWDPEHNKMGKGVTFTKAELSQLKALLNTLDLE